MSIVYKTTITNMATVRTLRLYLKHLT